MRTEDRPTSDVGTSNISTARLAGKDTSLRGASITRAMWRDRVMRCSAHGVDVPAVRAAPQRECGPLPDLLDASRRRLSADVPGGGHGSRITLHRDLRI